MKDKTQKVFAVVREQVKKDFIPVTIKSNGHSRAYLDPSDKTIKITKLKDNEGLYTKGKVIELLNDLYSICNEKAELEMHNEVFFGHIKGLTPEREKYLENFNVDVFVKENLK